MPDYWSWRNWIDDPGAMLQAAGSAPGFPVSNIQDPRVGRVWRTQRDATERYVDATFPVGRDVRLVGCFGGDLRANARFLLQLSSTSSGAFDVFDAVIQPTTDDRIRQWFWWPEVAGLGETVRVRRMRLSPIDTYEIGRLWATETEWRPEVGHILGSGFGVADYGRRQVTPISGTIITSRGARLRNFTARYDAISGEEARGAVMQMDLSAGATGQVLFIPNPDVYPPHRHAVLGNIEALNPIIAAGWRRNTREYTIQESG